MAQEKTKLDTRSHWAPPMNGNTAKGVNFHAVHQDKSLIERYREQKRLGKDQEGGGNTVY